MSDESSIELIERETALSLMIRETVPGLSFLLDSEGRTVLSNKAFSALFPAANPEAQADARPAIIRSFDRRALNAHIQEAFREGTATTELSVTGDGQRRYFQVTSTRAVLNQHTYLIGTGVDITESKAVEALMAGQNRVLVALATGQSLENVLTTLIVSAEEQCEGMLGSVMLLDEQGVHLSPCAAPSLPPEYLVAIAGLTIGPNVGSCGAAAYLRKPIFVESIEDHPNWIMARELTRHHGLFACWSHPIFSTDNQVLGTFAMYYRKTRRPDTTLMRIIESGAHLAGLAIERSRLDSQLKAAKDAADAANRELEQRVVDRTAELRDVHKQLLEVSRQAGMAEVATDVLHNLGNLLNSVNVSANVLRTLIEQSKVSNLSKASALLESHRHDLTEFLTADAKGKMLPNYFVHLAEDLNEENNVVLQEIADLARSIEHINDVIQTQQEHARNSTFRQLFNPAALFEEALRDGSVSLDRHSIEIVREMQNLGEVEIDKRKTLEILIGLVSNAKNALTQTKTVAGPRITARLSAIERDFQRWLRFEVSDNGVGIPAENQAKIFTSTVGTISGGRGFRLHNAANAAREMHGTLSVFSEGAGRGATFVLEIPLEQRGAAGQ